MVTSDTQFFGYGSLVNLATHDYRNPRKATVQGWRRKWEYSAAREISFLSVVKDPQSTIQGLVADVANIGWQALDIREAAYKRHALASASGCAGVQIYVADPQYVDPKVQDKPILLSYLDCVVQGYLQQFGSEGVTAFFDSTTGWERPIKNDRITPVYPRAQLLTASQLALVDDHLDRLSADIIS